MRFGSGGKKAAAAAGASEERRRVIRLYAFGLACTAWFALIGLRLWDLQVRQAGELSTRAGRQQEGLIEMPAQRGGIYDRNGVPLALSSSYDSIAVWTPKIGDPDVLAGVLAGVTGLPEAAIRDELGKKGFRYIKRFADEGQVERLREMRLHGVQFERETKRRYPKGAAAAHILGFVDIKEKGQGGLELRFDEVLQGRPGSKRVRVDAGGDEYEFEIVEPPIPGSDLLLTLDERIQAAAEESLQAAIEKTKARAGSIVVVEPQTGDVLAMASWPTFDPNERPSGASREQFLRDMARRDNYAVAHLYEPGSTFKIVTVGAALEEGLARPDEVIDCQDGWMYVGRRRIRDHHRFGPLSVAEILARSSNVGVIKLGLRLEADRLYDYVRRFGFGEKTGIDLPGEIPGLVRPLEEWKEGSIASIAMGHEIGATPLQMVAATAAAANGGYWVKPRLVDAVREPSGRIRTLEPSPRRRVISPETAAQLRMMMEQTVLAGTGRLAAVPGYRSGGKTGTAQMIDPETNAYSHDLYMAGYAGFAPLNDPAMASVIVLEAPQGDYYGGVVAAPVFPALAEQTLRFRDVPPDLTVEAEAPEKVETAALADVAVTTTLAAEGPALERASDGAIFVAAAESTFDELDAEPDDEVRPGPPARLRLTEILTPDFAGMTMRDAASEAVALGLRIETTGDGVAYEQDPPAGTPVARGSRVRLYFQRLTAQARVGR